VLLYHGTPNEFDIPSLTMCKPHRDFGRGFYLAAEYFDALPMAIKNASVGYVKTYEFCGAEDLDVIELNGYSDAWLELVIGSRLGACPNVDLVIGNTAGGGTNLQSKFSKLRRAGVSIREASALMRSELTNTKLGVQYCFLTPRAISKLRLVETEIIEREDIV